MDRSEKEVIRAHHLRQFHSFRKVFAGFFEEFINVLVYFGRIGTCRLEHHARHPRMTVHTTVISIAVLSQLYFGNVLQFQDFAIVSRTDDDFPEFFGSNQTSFIFHRVLISLVGVFTERTGCRFNILFGKHTGDVGRNQFILSHHIRLHPYTHTILTAHNHQVTHTRDTENLRFQVDADIVGKEVFIITFVRT